MNASKILASILIVFLIALTSIIIIVTLFGASQHSAVSSLYSTINKILGWFTMKLHYTSLITSIFTIALTISGALLVLAIASSVVAVLPRRRK